MQINFQDIVQVVSAGLLLAGIVGVFKVSGMVSGLKQWTVLHQKSDDERYEETKATLLRIEDHQ